MERQPAAADLTTCDGCGLRIDGGTDGCQALFDVVRARQISGAVAASYPTQRLTVDTYCVQHPERYCASAKSLAAHLTGLCWALEHPGRPEGLRTLQRWLDGARHLEKPAVPARRGDVNVADLGAGAEVEAGEHAAAVELWARSAWAAYAPLQATARMWVQLALESR